MSDITEVLVMPQPPWLHHLNVNHLRQLHDEKLAGATEQSFADTLENFGDYLSSEIPRHDLQGLIEDIRTEDTHSEMYHKAQRSLRAHYESMLGAPYYKTEKTFLPDGGFALRSFFGNVAADVRPERSQKMSNEFCVVIPSAREYPKEGLALPRPLSKRIWVEGGQRDLESEVRINDLFLVREGNYGALIRLSNGLQLRISTIDGFWEMVSGCEDLRTLLDAWNRSLGFELYLTIGMIGALKLFRERIADGHAADPAAERALKDAMFDLTYLIGAVNWGKALRMPLRNARDAIGLGENCWSAIFEAMSSPRSSIRLYLLPFIQPEANEGRYRQPVLFGERRTAPLDRQEIDRAVEGLARSAVHFANVPRLRIPSIPSANRSAEEILHTIGHDNPDPAAAVRTHEWTCSPCTSFAATAVTATAMGLSKCVGV